MLVEGVKPNKLVISADVALANVPPVALTKTFVKLLTVNPPKVGFENGTVSSSGEFVGGKKNGYWSSFNLDGTVRSEITYVNGTGEFREYFTGKKLKTKGRISDGLNDGKWEYYSSDGKLEGECDFNQGKGLYKGYYPTGTIQTKGQMEGDLRVETHCWQAHS